MNIFDLTVLQFVTSFANRSQAFDGFVASLINLELLKGGVTMAMFWAAWFRDDREQEERREILVAVLCGAALALAIAATLAMVLPFRLRPVLAFPTEGASPDPSWERWSAFPSDHATLFVALAFGLYRAWPALGWIALVHAALVVCFPRVYLGLHYPSDILAGGLLGVGCIFVSTGAVMRRRLAAWPLRWRMQHPASFYACLFLTSYSIATVFKELRIVGRALVAFWHP